LRFEIEVRKLRKSKCYQREDHNYIKEVSDNEVEVNLLDTIFFMHVADKLLKSNLFP